MPHYASPSASRSSSSSFVTRERSPVGPAEKRSNVDVAPGTANWFAYIAAEAARQLNACYRALRIAHARRGVARHAGSAARFRSRYCFCLKARARPRVCSRLLLVEGDGGVES
jgi:hypothetical protein